MLPDTSTWEIVDMENKLGLTNILSEQLETYLFGLGFLIDSSIFDFILLLNYFKKNPSFWFYITYKLFSKECYFSLIIQHWNFGFIHWKWLIITFKNHNTKILSSIHNFDTKNTKKSLLFFLNTKDTKILSSVQHYYM
jgi:hypothetical protein